MKTLRLRITNRQQIGALRQRGNVAGEYSVAETEFVLKADTPSHIHQPDFVKAFLPRSSGYNYPGTFVIETDAYFLFFF